MNFTTLTLEQRGSAGLIILNRPQSMNMLDATVAKELNQALDMLEADPRIGAIVLTGAEGVFAAGSDVREMRNMQFPATYATDFQGLWDRVANKQKPLIAAVSGFALGGGCELALMCDIIIATDSAKFGQPEINLGVIPNMGATQRLVHAVGKAKAMDMCLTGRLMDAAEAERSGLVARVVPANELLAEAVRTAETIGSKSPVVTAMIKECVNRAFETPLSEGIRFERRLFQALFATQDQKEGMSAFLEKRPANFQGK